MGLTVAPIVGGIEYSLGSLGDSLGFLTRVIQVQIKDRIRRSGRFRISLATLTLLQLVGGNPGIRQANAARLLLIQDSNLAVLVRELVEKGLVERRPTTGERDGLWLTAAGAQLVEEHAATAGLDRDYAAVLSDGEYRQLLALLNRVYRSAVS